METKKIAYGLYVLGLMSHYSGESRLYGGVLDSTTKVIGIKNFEKPPIPISCCEEYVIGFGCSDKGLYIAAIEPIEDTLGLKELVPVVFREYKLHLYSNFKLIGSDTGVIDMILYNNINESEDIQFTSTAFGPGFIDAGYSEKDKKIKVCKFIEDNLKIIYNPSQRHLYNELYSIYDFYYYAYNRICNDYPDIGKIIQSVKELKREQFVEKIQRGV